MISIRLFCIDRCSIDDPKEKLSIKLEEVKWGKVRCLKILILK